LTLAAERCVRRRLSVRTTSSSTGIGSVTALPVSSIYGPPASSDAAVQDFHVVTSWPSVPVEIVRAAGLCPVIVRGRSGPTPAADLHLEPDIFPGRLRRLVDDALTGRLAGSARIVIPRTPDADYKCFLSLRERVRRGMATALPPVVLFDLLQPGGPEVPAYNAARTRALVHDLSSASGRRPSTGDLRREIMRANAARAA